MATIFTHSLIGLAVGKIFGTSNLVISKKRFWILSFVCPALPDTDSLGLLYLGIPYEHIFGHRGFTHSIFFSVFLGFLVVFLFFRKENLNKLNSFLLIMYFTLITTTHSILDALTNGGLGIAFFSPFDNSRHFFPYRPLEVSPLSIEKFFKERGLDILSNELIWVLIPALIFIFIKIVIKKMIVKYKSKTKDHSKRINYNEDVLRHQFYGRDKN